MIFLCDVIQNWLSLVVVTLLSSTEVVEIQAELTRMLTQLLKVGIDMKLEPTDGNQSTYN